MLPRTPPRRQRGAWAASRPTTGIAIDLGSARTRAWSPDRGLIIDVPTTTSSGGEVCHPVRRGTVVDLEGAASMLDHRLGRPAGFGRYSIAVLTIPVLCDDQQRNTALTALKILDARTVLTIHSVKAAALGAGAGLNQPLLVMDIGAHLTEVGLLVDGGVVHGRRIEAGTSDLGATTTVTELVQSIVAMVTSLLRLDCGGQVVDALNRGPLLTGGGALRPEITYRLAKRLAAPVRSAPAPQFAAVRGAGLALVAAGHHPAFPLEGPL